MAIQNVVPAYRSASAGVGRPSAQVETTTARAAILKQIGVLQKQEAALGEQLAKLGNGPESAQARIAIQQKIHSLEDQIKALQMALLQKNADRKVQVAAGKPVEKQADKQAEKQAEKPAEKPAETRAGNGDAAAHAAGDAPRTAFSGGGIDDGAVVGGVIDTTA